MIFMFFYTQQPRNQFASKVDAISVLISIPRVQGPTGAIEQSNAHLTRGHDFYFLNFLHRRVAGEGVRQASGQVLIQEVKVIREAAEILNLGQEIRETLIRGRRAIDVGQGYRVSIQIGNPLARPLAHPEKDEQESRQAEKGNQNSQELMRGSLWCRVIH
jgi:hypothetical protein